MTRPALAEVKEKSAVAVELELGGRARFKSEATVVWVGDDIVGMELRNLSLEAKERLDQFLDNRLIGKNLVKVDPRFYVAGQATFTEWFHGPRGTNVFLWLSVDGRHIARAEIELDNETLVLADGQWRFGGENGSRARPDTPMVRQVMEILSQMKNPEASLKVLLESLMTVS